MNNIKSQDGMTPAAQQRPSWNMLPTRAYLADIASSDADNLCAGTNCCDVLGSLFCLLHVTSNNAGVGTQTHKRPRLHTADRASTTRHKGDATLCCTDSPLAKEHEQNFSLLRPEQVVQGLNSSRRLGQLNWSRAANNGLRDSLNRSSRQMGLR